MVDLEIARNTKASPESLDRLVDKYDSRHRDLGEALILNHNLKSEALTKLLSKSPLDLQILAIKHPNLCWEDQIRIASLVDTDDLRTKARLLLLEREDLDIRLFAVLCLDPNSQVREKAQVKLKEVQQ
jgi:hypothetical protein